MIEIKVNGVTHQVETDKKLMRYLRDDLHLTSVKDGCSEGACGTCTIIIDGKIMSGKALIDSNPNPTRLEVINAIKRNICRCTGYKKIIEGILLAAQIFRENRDLHLEDGQVNVGERIARIDARDKALGVGEYPDDIYLDGMIYGSALRAEYPRARILSIDTQAAKALPWPWWRRKPWRSWKRPRP